MGSNAGKIISAVAPLAISFAAPELAPFLGITSTLGTAGLGAALGGGAGLLSGGGIKGALTNALASGLGAGGGDLLSGATGLTGTGAAALSKGLTGAATGFNGTGTGQGALLGGGIGALTGALSSALSPAQDITSKLGTGAGGNALTIADGSQVPAGLTGAPGQAVDLSGSAGANGMTSGGTLTGAAGGGASSFGGAATGAAGTAGSSFNANSLQALLSGVGNVYNQNQEQDALTKAQQANTALLAPFTANGVGASNDLATMLGTNGNTGAAGYGSLTKPFTPGDLTQDPGYQFNLQQGQNALNNQLSASGSLDSGAALKAAQQFGQGLADTTYNNAFARDNTNKVTTAGLINSAVAPGLAGAEGTAQANTALGNVGANATAAKGNTITSALSNVLNGAGAKQIIGYKPDGTPIYQ